MAHALPFCAGNGEGDDLINNILSADVSCICFCSALYVIGAWQRRTQASTKGINLYSRGGRSDW